MQGVCRTYQLRETINENLFKKGKLWKGVPDLNSFVVLVFLAVEVVEFEEPRSLGLVDRTQAVQDGDCVHRHSE